MINQPEPDDSEPNEPDPALSDHLRRFRSPLVALVASWGAPWSEATELAQDSFADAYLRRAACRGDWRSPDFFGRWLRGVARNKYREWTRRRRRDAHADLLEAACEAASPGSDLPERAEEQERDERVRAAIQSLPEQHRAVVLMRYFDDTPLADIAKVLGTSPRAIEGRLYQARKKLSALLSNERLANTVKGVLLCL